MLSTTGPRTEHNIERFTSVDYPQSAVKASTSDVQRHPSTLSLPASARLLRLGRRLSLLGCFHDTLGFLLLLLPLLPLLIISRILRGGFCVSQRLHFGDLSYIPSELSPKTTYTPPTPWPSRAPPTNHQTTHPPTIPSTHPPTHTPTHSPTYLPTTQPNTHPPIQAAQPHTHTPDHTPNRPINPTPKSALPHIRPRSRVSWCSR